MTDTNVSRREATVLLAALAVMAMGLVLRNGWAQDDVDLIAGNAAVHQWSGLWTGFTSSWWPAPYLSGLYRPLARTLTTLEWHAGQGAPWVFHATSLLLYLGAVLSVHRLASKLLSEGAALGAAALFAAHPVHVEAVALGVNQGELVVAALACTAATLLIDLRRGARTAPRTWPLIWGCIAAALLFKEHAVVVPVLLIGIDLFLARTEAGSTGSARWTGHLGGVALVIVFLIVRASVLGSLAGAAPAAGLAPHDAVARALTMLGVVPVWARLLLWPATLQADYSPMEIVPWAGWTLAQTLGVGVLLAWGGAGLAAIRRAPVAALGLAWIAVALLPVSNVLIPTGLLVGERTLFLPSVGLALAAGGAWPLIRTRLASDRLRRVVLLVTAAVLGAGAIRSAARMPVWRDQATHLTSQLEDAPRSYRAQMGFGVFRYEVMGDRAGGERHLREAIALSPGDPWPYLELADRYRNDGLCPPAIDLYGRALQLSPERDDMRAAMIACFFMDGQWGAAARAARDSAILAVDLPFFTRAAGLADSAARAGAAAGSVALPDLPGHLLRVGPRNGW